MIIRTIAYLVLLGFLTQCSETYQASTIRFPYEWVGTPGFGGNIDQQNIPEPSGICFHPHRKTLFVVSDEGEIFEIRTDGTPVSSRKIPGDLEGLTVDPRSGLLYILVEGKDHILEFDPAAMVVTRDFSINREYQGNPNFLEKQPTGEHDNGCEAIAFVPNEEHPEGGTFFVGNQWDPPCLMELLVPLVSTDSEKAEARIVRVLPVRIDDPGAMFYDYASGYLNVVSDADNILFELTPDGQVVHQYAFLGDNQEGLDRDEEGYLYLAQDSGDILRVKDLRTAN